MNVDLTKLRKLILYSPETDGEGNGKDETDDGDNGDDGNSEATFETWLSDQPEDVQTMYSSHVHGLKSALDKERANNKELKALRKRVKEIDDAEAEKEREKLSEVEKLKADLDSAILERENLQKSLRTERTEHVIEIVAMQMNFHDPSDVVNLVDLSDISDNELEKEVKDQLKEIAKKKPYLVKMEDRGDGFGTTRTKTKLEKKTKETTEKPRTGIKF